MLASKRLVRAISAYKKDNATEKLDQDMIGRNGLYIPGMARSSPC
jgi:hypothetical protein